MNSSNNAQNMENLCGEENLEYVVTSSAKGYHAKLSALINAKRYTKKGSAKEYTNKQISPFKKVKFWKTVPSSHTDQSLPSMVGTWTNFVKKK